MDTEWKLDNETLGKMAVRRMGSKQTLKQPKVWVDQFTGTGLVCFDGEPDCLCVLERALDVGEAL